MKKEHDVKLDMSEVSMLRWLCSFTCNNTANRLLIVVRVHWKKEKQMQRLENRDWNRSVRVSRKVD